MLTLVVAAGWTLGAIVGPAHGFNAIMALGSIALAGLIAWRLWLNTRSLGKGGPIPSRQKMLKVYFPLGLLAVVGLVAICTGLAMIAAWSAVIFGDAPAAGGYRAPELSYFGAIGAGVLIAGASLCWPLLRRLRSPRTDANATLEDHD